MLEQDERQPIRYDERHWRPRPTLSGAQYVSEEVYAEEKERIWWNDWVCIGREEEVAKPGGYLVRELAGESIFVTRDHDGGLNGFYNVCSHRGTKFLDDEPASGNVRKAFSCPYHGWTYDLKGCLLGTPNVKEGEQFDRADYPLHGFAVQAHSGFLFANLSEEPRPFLDAIGEGAENITMFERFKMEELRVEIGRAS